MAVLPTGIGPVTGYNIERSLRFNSADSAYLSRTPASASNRKTWTWSGWVKRSTLSGTRQGIFNASNAIASAYWGLEFDASEKLNIYDINSAGVLTTAAVYRDISAWYHIVVALDTTQATASNRVKLYVNGIQVTTFSAANYPPLNADSNVNSTLAHSIGSWVPAGTLYFNGYMTEINFIDGQALTPSDFGETDASTGVWKPKAYSGTYGTNGFFLKFADNSNTTAATLGKDSSGNGNNWTPNLFSVTAGSGNDSLVDTPTNYGTDTGAGGEVRGNYSTLSSIDSGRTLVNGNLEYSGAASGIAKGTFAVSSGKWYWECQRTGSANSGLGICTIATAPTTTYLGGTAGGYSYFSNGTTYNNGSVASYGTTYTTSDIIGVALDLDAGTLVFYKNGVSQGTAFSGLSGTFTAAAGNNTTTDAGIFNFGQRPFQKWNGSAYVANTAPSGFKALCTQNLPTPTIGATSTTQAKAYFDVTTYTGNNSTPRSITGLNFQPDWVWIKDRSSAYNHTLWDAVRGVGSNKGLSSNSTDPEGLGVALGSTAANGYVSALNSNGFQVTSGSSTNVYVNTSPDNYVGWNWKANGAGSTNTAGTITSTVSANTTSGFSIVTYTGTGTAGTIGHGLGAAPQMIIVKNRNTSSYGWFVWHTAFGAAGNTDYITLNLSDAKGSGGAVSMWNTTMPTSSVFSIGTYGGVNGNTNTYVVYCFAPVAGYSAFGSYTGNGSTDGVFVYTGFRPRWIMYKNSGATGNWGIVDTVRSPYNPDFPLINANSANAEAAVAAFLDVTANGFKFRTSGTDFNASSNTYIYAAFAEHPFKYSLAR